MKRITLCGEYYSSNFGDGIIVDSTKYILEKNYPNMKINIMDFSGRESFQNIKESNTKKNSQFYRKIISFAMKNPKLVAVRNEVLWNYKIQKRMKDYYLEKLKDTDTLIFSGGHILMNNNLVYPLRLKLICEIAEEKGIDIVFNSCGSEQTNSKKAIKIFQRVFSSPVVKSISVRDNIENIINLNGNKKIEGNKVRESHDAAVVIADAYNLKKQESNIIGLGVISYVAYLVANSRSNNKYFIAENEMIEKWIKIVEALVNEGKRVKLISNGGHHDNSMVLKLQQLLNVEVETVIPKNPSELVEGIANCSQVLAHRLHANIISYSLNIPTIGFVWDEKLIEFGKKINREEFFVDLNKTSIDEIIELVKLNEKEGYLNEIRTHTKQEAEESLLFNFEMANSKE